MEVEEGIRLVRSSSVKRERERVDKVEEEQARKKQKRTGRRRAAKTLEITKSQSVQLDKNVCQICQVMNEPPFFFL